MWDFCYSCDHCPPVDTPLNVGHEPLVDATVDTHKSVGGKISDFLL